MKLLSLTVFLLSAISLLCQDEDLEALADELLVEEHTDYATATFKATRIINGHSIERMQSGELDFRIAHRFDRINKGLYEFFGLDDASTYFSLELGITDWLMAGVGRATVGKYYNGFLKFSVLRQSTGKINMPVSLSAYTSMAGTSVKFNKGDIRDKFSSRLNYTFQLLIARKFSTDFSVQLSPTMVHRNLIRQGNENDLYSIGIAGRYKLTNWVAVNAEYFYVINKDSDISEKYYDPISIGFDIETGGHVFQLQFTNAISMIESGFLGQTTGNWLDGDIHIGFNISRVFTIY